MGVDDRKILIQLRLANRPENWYLQADDAVPEFQRRLGERLGRFNMDGPKAWIGEKPASMTDRGWYIVRQGKVWNGKELKDLEGHSLRFPLRGDSVSGHQMKTRGQA
jgi:hypothetical protein